MHAHMHIMHACTHTHTHTHTQTHTHLKCHFMTRRKKMYTNVMKKLAQINSTQHTRTILPFNRSIKAYGSVLVSSHE